MLKPIEAFINPQLDEEIARLVPDGDPSDHEAWKKAQVLRGRPPMDATEFAKRLEGRAAESLLALAQIVQSGAFRDTNDFALDFGYDLAGDGVEILLDGQNVTSDVFSLGNDMSGNVFLVLPDGRVGIWSPNEGTVEEHTRFPSLDALIWTLVHVHAATEAHLEFHDVHAVLGKFEPETGPYWMLEELAEKLGAIAELRDQEELDSPYDEVSGIHVLGEHVWCVCNSYQGSAVSGSVMVVNTEDFDTLSECDSYTGELEAVLPENDDIYLMTNGPSSVGRSDQSEALFDTEGTVIRFCRSTRGYYVLTSEAVYDVQDDTPSKMALPTEIRRVERVVEARSGIRYLCTNAGLFRSSGDGWTKMPTPKGAVADVAEFGPDELVVAGPNGLAGRVSGDSFHPFRVEGAADFFCVESFGGEVLFGAGDAGVYLLEDDDVTVSKPNVKCIDMALHNEYLFTAGAHLVCRYDGTGVTGWLGIPLRGRS